MPWGENLSCLWRGLQRERERILTERWRREGREAGERWPAVALREQRGGGIMQIDSERFGPIVDQTNLKLERPDYPIDCMKLGLSWNKRINWVTLLSGCVVVLRWKQGCRIKSYKEKVDTLVNRLRRGFFFLLPDDRMLGVGNYNVSRAPFPWVLEFMTYF